MVESEFFVKKEHFFEYFVTIQDFDKTLSCLERKQYFLPKFKDGIPADAMINNT